MYLLHMPVALALKVPIPHFPNESCPWPASALDVAAPLPALPAPTRCPILILPLGSEASPAQALPQPTMSPNHPPDHLSRTITIRADTDKKTPPSSQSRTLPFLHLPPRTPARVLATPPPFVQHGRRKQQEPSPRGPAASVGLPRRTCRIGRQDCETQ